VQAVSAELKQGFESATLGQDWHWQSQEPIKGSMSILPPISTPSAVYADLKAFWRDGPRYRIIFAITAIVIPFFLITLFLLSSRDAPYKPPEIIYVENWKAGRTDAEIKAQQKIDTAKRKDMEARIAKAEAEKRAYFKNIQDNMKKWGF
jgi:hypothetical protein